MTSLFVHTPVFNKDLSLVSLLKTIIFVMSIPSKEIKSNNEVNKNHGFGNYAEGL